MRINPEKKEDRERVAQELLRVTLRLASEHGFVSLGLREVSRAAEIAPTSFYRHFADMEELGRALIDGLAGPFIDGWIGAARTATGGESRVLAIALSALAEAGRDPELMRFILAEQRGAIPGFRQLIATKLSSASDAVKDAIAAEVPGDGSRQEEVAHGIVLLILGACAELLDQGLGRLAAISERLVAQIRWFLAGAGLKEKR